MALLILSQLVVRAWMAAQRELFQDDFLYGSQALEMPLFSAEYLVEDRGGHFMPGAMLLHGILYRLFPLEWGPFAVVLVALQAAAALAVLRLLRVLLGDRPRLLVPLAVYLFSPLILGAYVWWAAAMNSLPLQIGLAWVAADAVLLVRSRRRRYAVTGALALVATLLFYERAVLIVPFAFLLTAVLLHGEGVAAPIREAWTRGRALWIGSAAVLAGWFFTFTLAVPSEAVGSATLAQIGQLTSITVRSFVPALFGGPWRWADIAGSPAADPSPTAVTVSVVLLSLLVGWTVLRRRGAAWMWMLAAGYFLAGTLLVGAGRAAFGVSSVLPLAYRYFAAEAVIAAVVVAVLLVLPLHHPGEGGSRTRVVAGRVADGIARRPAGARAARTALALSTVAFVASSLWTTVGYMDVWENEPSRPYLATAKDSLAAAGEEPLLDQPVADHLVWSLMTPWNEASKVFGPLEDRPAFARSTHELRMLDDTGRMRPAIVDGGIRLAPGPDGGCGWAVSGGRAVDVSLDAPLFAWVWTAELDYEADRDGTISVTLGSDTVEAPVRQGSNTLYLRFISGGDELVVTPGSDDLGLCVREGVVGNIALR
ncbi:hypothetical protein [Blastococcus sp. TF02A-35]|uniref:hypothetical protein n=1 Tax=Blastococcus sp. TF02A-35 TaxID=2559612 RepID=UPI00107480E9|nr:hypothetical protein [Blastococcus sp. TF02A_35]TFV45961.1 hypothetical protein E4P43_17035 [Blastococcus sp. TF02A_35]